MATITAADIDNARKTQGIVFSDFYTRVKTFLVEWQVNVPDVTTMNALGYTDAAKQQALLQWQANLAAVVSLVEGAANTHNMVPDIAREKGVGS